MCVCVCLTGICVWLSLVLLLQLAGQADDDQELKDDDVGEENGEVADEDEEEDQDAELQRALEMSLKDALPPQ